MRYTRIVDTPTKRLTPIQWALERGHAPIIELLYTEQPQTVAELLAVLITDLAMSQSYHYVAGKYLDADYTGSILAACVEAGLVQVHP